MIVVKSGKDLPPGAVLLSEDEAAKKIWEAVNSWKKSDVFALKYGSIIPCAASFLTLCYYNQYYRRRFKCRSYGQQISYFVCAFAPSLFANFGHMEFTVRDIILQRPCEWCVLSKAIGIQFVFSSLYGLILPSLTSMWLALTYATYDNKIPGFQPRYYRELFRLWGLQTRRIQSQTMFFFIMNVFAVCVAYYWEKNTFETFFEKWQQFQIEREQLIQELNSKEAA